MSEYSKLITLIDLLAIAIFTGYAGIFLLPMSVIAAVAFLLLTCLPLYAIGMDVFAKKQIIKAPVEDFVMNLFVIIIPICQLGKTPELATFIYAIVTVGAIDLCANILNFISPRKEYLTYKNASIHKTAGILTVTEWILIVALCAFTMWTFWSEKWWLIPVTTIALAALLFFISHDGKNPGNSAPLGGIILDIFLLACCTIAYCDEPDYSVITLLFTATVAIDFIRCILRKTCTISSLDQI